jgi:hypothetical protein
VATRGHRCKLVFFYKDVSLLWKFVIQIDVEVVYRKKGPCELQKQGCAIAMKRRVVNSDGVLSTSIRLFLEGIQYVLSFKRQKEEETVQKRGKYNNKCVE